MKAKITSSFCTSVFLMMLFISCTIEKAQPPSEVETNCENIHTPTEALSELLDGNHRFLEEHLKNIHFKAEIEHTKYQQHPHSLILTCIDSRVPPEIIFDQGIGNIFVSRIAGNIEDEDVLGNMEFAAEIKHIKLIVVLGHSHCGAVEGAVNDVNIGHHLSQLTDQIKPAIKEQQSYPVQDDMLDLTSKENVRMTIKHILARSKILSSHIDHKDLGIVGAFYNVENGAIEIINYE